MSDGSGDWIGSVGDSGGGLARGSVVWRDLGIVDYVSAPYGKVGGTEMKQLHFEIDDELAARWRAVVAGMKKGMPSKLLRGTLLLVIRQLESGRTMRVSEVVQLELRKEEEVGTS